MKVHKVCALNLVEEKLSDKVFVRLICLVHFGFIAINLTLQYGYHRLMFLYPDLLGVTTNLLEMVLPIFCHFVFVAEALIKRKKQAKIEILIKNLCSKFNKETNDFPVFQFLLLFVINSTIYIAVCILVRGTPGKYLVHF